jgi:membrane-bound lytic murein transglycosylase A
LKKRTKKLLSVAGSTVLANLARPLAAVSKSFLVLFFKKELLPFLLLASCAPPAAAPPPAPPPPPLFQPASFNELPGWNDDRLADLLPALRLQCTRLALLPADTSLGGEGLAAAYGGLAGQWSDACTAAMLLAPGDDPRLLFQSRFQPYRVPAQALITGYFEPLIPGSLQRFGAYQTPVLARPSDLREGTARDAEGRPVLGRLVNGSLVPYYTRAEIEAGAADTATRPIAWVRSLEDLFFAQIQGAMLLQLPDGGTARLAFDGRNGRPYTPIGRILKDQGAIAGGEITMQSIRAWLDAHPASAKTLMDRNESYVFFRLAPDSDPSLGPPGALGVALTEGRSAAVDKRYLPLAAPLFIATTIPDGRPWRHLVLAQDLGSGIQGVAHVDVFFGAGAPAAAWAGAMHQPGQVWLLLPRPAGRSRVSAMSQP